MKHFTLLKLNSAGIGHVLVLSAVILGIAIVGTYMLVSSQAAVVAKNIYVVKADYRPTSGGRGIWIANNANGYIIGRAFPGDKIQVVVSQNSCQDNNPNRCEMWAYGLIKSDRYKGGWRVKPVYTYGWVKKGDLRPIRMQKITDNAHILAQKNRVEQRNNIGGTFNCVPHECIGGKTVRLVKGCYTGEYYNLADNGDGRLRPYDKAGMGARGGLFDYRYTTVLPTPQGGYYAMGRDHRLGWVFIDDQCIPAGTERFGGPKFKY